MMSDTRRLLSGSTGKGIVDQVFTKYDKNQDGNLSRAEHAQVFRDAHSVLDTSILNPIPGPASRKRQLAFDNVDRNGDDTIQRHELQTTVDAIRSKGISITTAVVVAVVAVVAYFVYSRYKKQRKATKEV